MFPKGALSKLAVLAMVAIVLFALAPGAGAQQVQNGITSPKAAATASGTVTVKGYASDPRFARWQLDLLPSGDANAAIFLAQGKTPGEFTVSQDLTRFPSGNHALRLRVVRQDANYDEFISGFTLANPGAPTVPPAPASPEANKALVRQFVTQVLNGRNPNAVDQFDAPNFKRYLSPVAAPLDAQGQKKRLAGFFAAFPDLQFTIGDMIAEGDRVVYRLTAHGTQKGSFQGIAPTGKPVTVTSIEIARIQDGKYVELWGGPDTLDMLQQVGATVSAR